MCSRRLVHPLTTGIAKRINPIVERTASAISCFLSGMHDPGMLRTNGTPEVSAAGSVQVGQTLRSLRMVSSASTTISAWDSSNTKGGRIFSTF